MSEWNEFRVRLVRTWNREMHRRADPKNGLTVFSPAWPKGALWPNWGIRLDTTGVRGSTVNEKTVRGGVNLGEILTSWKDHAVYELMMVGSSSPDFRVGLFVVDDARMETLKGDLRLILETRTVVMATTPEEAAIVLHEFKARGKLPDDITVLSDLEHLAKVGQETGGK